MEPFHCRTDEEFLPCLRLRKEAIKLIIQCVDPSLPQFETNTGKSFTTALHLTIFELEVSSIIAKKKNSSDISVTEFVDRHTFKIQLVYSFKYSYHIHAYLLAIELYAHFYVDFS